MKILQNIPLSKKTFYGIGGPADTLYELDHAEELGEIWAETIQNDIPKIVLGGGANIALSDAGFRGSVFIPKFNTLTWDANRVKVEAGTNWQQFVEATNTQGYSDLCPLSGIPGNVGGFIRGNAGAYGLETGDKVVSVDYLDAQGQIQTARQDECNFVYRGSLFKQNPDFFIVAATFELDQENDLDQALEKTRTLQRERWKKYPAGRSGGCVFKNPDPEKGLLAGKILDEMDLKGLSEGAIEISAEHANFFVNKGQGTQADLIKLIKNCQKRVLEAHGIKLEPEIFLADEYGRKIDL